MAKQSLQKQKLLYLQKILLEKTDENHGLTVNEIIQELNQYGITAERKSIYNDLEILKTSWLDICAEKTKTVRYSVVSRAFEISELKLLVDAVQSSKFMTEDKSLKLIKKLEGLASVHEAQLLRRQVYIYNRVKTDNEIAFYNVDGIHEAINNNKIIEFYYNRWVLNFNSSEKIKAERRKNGERYQVSPWCLCWDDENYYLIAYDHNSGEIRHYRVDKMERIQVIDTPRHGRELFDEFDIAGYTKSTFSMFAGNSTEITLSVHNDLVGVIADRFGRNIFIKEDTQRKNHFIMKTNVNLSQQFFGWLFALGDQVQIIEPDHVIDKYKKQLEAVTKIYEKEAF